MNQPLLKLEGIDKSFPGVKALSHASLSVYKGKVMALLGENGAGKSTLMRVLTGIYTKDSGTIHYLGKDITFKSPKESQEAGIGIIHQELNLISELSIAENIFLGREFTNAIGMINWKKMYGEADKLLARLKVKHSSKRLVGSLSIGDQQLVEIAKVLSFNSRIIIMDEPTDALTDTETETLFTIINELRADGCGIVYISHRLKEIFEICDDVTVLRDGAFIMERPVAEITEETLIESMVGRKLEEQFPRLNRDIGKETLSVNELNGHGIKNVSFSLHEGEILGVSGLMGSGRTELMKMIYGALPSTGKISIYGKEVKPHTLKAATAAGIVYISEDRKRDGLILGMSVKENISLTALKHLSYNLGLIKQTAEKDAVNHYITAFNIRTPTINQPVGLLSGGNQQKVSIARGLLTDPVILILDEPTRGVDVGAKVEIYDLINEFKSKGLSIILVSSEMPEILGMSDRILVMHEGIIKAEFSHQDATQEKLMAAAVGNLKEPKNG